MEHMLECHISRKYQTANHLKMNPSFFISDNSAEILPSIKVNVVY
jgi:hypothetical protein